MTEGNETESGREETRQISYADKQAELIGRIPLLVDMLDAEWIGSRHDRYVENRRAELVSSMQTIRRTIPPEVLRCAAVPVKMPGEGEQRIKLETMVADTERRVGIPQETYAGSENFSTKQAARVGEIISAYWEAPRHLTDRQATGNVASYGAKRVQWYREIMPENVIDVLPAVYVPSSSGVLPPKVLRGETLSQAEYRAYLVEQKNVSTFSFRELLGMLEKMYGLEGRE